MELVAHHDVHPHLLVAGDLFHQPLEHLAVQAFLAKDLADLLGLHVGKFLDFLLLLGEHREVIVTLSEERGVHDAAHGDRLRERGGQRRRENDAQLHRGGGDPKDQPQHIDQPVLAAQDDVAKRSADPAVIDIRIVQRLRVTRRLGLSHRSLSSQLAG